MTVFNSEQASRMRYNILFLAKWYPNKFDPQLGVFIQKHAKAVSLYSNVCVLNLCADSTLQTSHQKQVTEDKGFKEIIVYYKSSNSILKPIINSYRYLKAFKTGLDEARQTLGVIDLIHVHVLTRLGVLALLINKLKHIPYIVTEHWTGYVSGKYEQQNGFKKWLTRKVLKNADAITTVSENLKKSMQHLGLQGNYKVIPNVIETVKLQDSTPPTSTIKLLTIADLVDAHKNISGIIKAVANIYKQHPTIEYHIVGDGADKELLTTLAKEVQNTNNYIFFHGRKPNEYVYDLLKQVNFVVINSNYETFSVVAAEALANGKPVISTVCGGPEEFITSEYGILIEPNNSKQLEAAILTMIETYPQYNPVRLNQYITQKLNYQAVGEQLYELYRGIIKNFTVGLSGHKQPIEPQWLVLDVGSGHRPNRRANVLIDNEINETVHRSGKKAYIPSDKKMVVGDALNMPFKNKEFDFIIASHIAEHIDDPEQFCKELARVGKRGYIETPGRVDEFFLNEPFHKWIVTKQNNSLVFTEKTDFKPFSNFFYGLYYLNENRTGHKPLHSSNPLLKIISKSIGRIWPHIPNTYTRFYWEDVIDVKVIRKK